MKIQDFYLMKTKGIKITMSTCYDYTSAKIIAASDVDCILVGDSVAMVMHGHDTTLPATMAMMALHIAAVARGADKKFVIGDMPFLSYRKGLQHSMDAMGEIMCAGAHAVKLEGSEGNLDLIAHAVASGVPIMGHLGLTPQSVHQLGGMRVQAREEKAAEQLLQQAQALQQAGCFAVVLELVPSSVALRVTEQLDIPTIGIGAGPHTSGQVLVWQDFLGMQKDFKPKFLKTYLNGFDLIQGALNAYNREVKLQTFPDIKEHCYHEID